MATRALPPRCSARVAPLAACLLLAGCPAPPRAVDDAQAQWRASRNAREAALNREWQNRPLAELLRSRGRPLQLLNIPGGGNPPGLVVVYPRDPATGCLDAFAVAYGPVTLVRVYQCR